MRESRRDPEPVPEPGVSDSEVDDLRAARWRQAQEIHTLIETLLVYRRGASALADEVAELRHELAAARSLQTRTSSTLDGQHEVEITLAADEDAPAVVALAVGEALAGSRAEAVDAWQTIASDLTDRAVLRYATRDDDTMLLLRIQRSDTAVGVEILEG